MFLLSETELINSILLKNISRIDISFYKFRNESFNLFNLELDFNENLIPLITSTLECKPFLINRKTYFGIDNDYIIERNIDCINQQNSILDKEEYSHNNKVRFQSFYLDIDNFNQNTLRQKTYWQSKKLLYSIVYSKSQELVRIYSREDDDLNSNVNNTKKQIFNPQDTLGYKEEIVIYWLIPGICKFELCISSNNSNSNRKQCIWRLVIDVIEDNNFINSKIDTVNTWLEKIHKIKSTIKIANQETNNEEI
jgi:hypothetical protein